MNRKSIVQFFILIILVLIASPQLQSQQVERDFKNPPTSFRPMVRWFWPGGDVNDAELRAEIDEMYKTGWGGAEIQPFNFGLKPDIPKDVQQRVNDYLTPDFYSHVTATLEQARLHGMWVDYTFGSGWPFGGAGVVTPEFSSLQLLSAHQTIRGPVHFHGKLLMPQLSSEVQAELARMPESWVKLFHEREKLVAVVAVRGSSLAFYPSQFPFQQLQVKTIGELVPGSAVVLTSRVQPDGTLDWDVPPGIWQVFTYKQAPSGQEVGGGIGSGPQLVLDHMSRRAFEAYADRVGGGLRKSNGQFFGNTLRAVFCDSLEVTSGLHWYDYYWSDDFLREFKARRGYDLTPYLPIIKIPGTNIPYRSTAPDTPLYNIAGISDRVRRDYWQTVSDVMIQNFYEPFNQWASENHLLSRVQSHGSPTDLLRVYGEASIPETESLYDNGRYDFLKMASSGGDLYGHKIVSSESFVWENRLYQVTPEMLKRFSDEMITAGINEIIYGGFPYKYMDRPFPGWYPFPHVGAYSSDLNSTNPFWPFFPELNAYITRLQYISQTGKTVVPIALYTDKLAYDNVDPWPPEPAINTSLMDAGYNFDHIDASILLGSHVQGGKLVSVGGARFSALVIPRQNMVSAAVAAQLKSFAREGLLIVFIGSTPGVTPSVADGKPVPGLLTGQFQSLVRDHRVLVVPTAEDVIGELKHASVAPNLRFDGPPLSFIEKRIGQMDAFFFRNSTDVPVSTAALFSNGEAPQWWNPWTGDIRPVKDSRRDGNQTRVAFELQPYGSALLVFHAIPSGSTAPDSSERRFGFAAAAPGDLPTRTLAVQTVGVEGWKFHGVGIGPNSVKETVDLDISVLADWTSMDRLKNFSGQGEYDTTFNVPADWLASGRRVVLDLGSVKDAAKIVINGNPGPDLLIRPYEADITGLVHAGENNLQVTVINTLFNALSAKGSTLNYSPERAYSQSGLLPSGLIGPVVLRSER